MKKERRINWEKWAFILTLISFIIYGGINQTTEWISGEELSTQNYRSSVIVGKSIDIPEGLNIVNFSTSKKIYEPREEVRIEFNVTNTLYRPYNISVDFLFEDERFSIWNNSSKGPCSFNRTLCGYYSSYSPKTVGNWRIQIVVKSEQNSTIILSEEIVEFEVI